MPLDERAFQSWVVILLSVRGASSEKVNRVSYRESTGIAIRSVATGQKERCAPHEY